MSTIGTCAASPPPSETAAAWPTVGASPATPPSASTIAPRFRQKVVFPPLATARPVWVDDPNFDVDFHIRRAALPAPGGRRELIDYVQRVISRPLDRTKPLWELYLIEGMEGGMTSILTKVHHAMVDGMAAI